MSSPPLARQRGLDVIACVWVAQVLLDLGARLPLGRYSPTNRGKTRVVVLVPPCKEVKRTAENSVI